MRINYIGLINPTFGEGPKLNRFILGTSDEHLPILEPLHLRDHISMCLQYIDRHLRLNIPHRDYPSVVTSDDLSPRFVPHADQPDTRFTLEASHCFSELLLAWGAHIIEGHVTVRLPDTKQIVHDLETHHFRARWRLKLSDHL